MEQELSWQYQLMMKRDYEFAKKFGIDIVPVIEQITGEVKRR